MTELRENSAKNIDSYKLLVDEYEDKCTHCLLEEMSAIYNEDIALEMSLGLDY